MNEDSLDPDVVERLLGLPPGLPAWQAADAASRGRVLATWLSSATLRGIPISEGARSYLDRVRRRVAELHGLGDTLSAAHGLRVLKGARIAAYMPPGLLRQSGDCDLVAPDEDALWNAALELRERLGAVPRCVSVLRSGGHTHVAVFLKWPAEEPFLDKPMGVDITTYAFGGDLKRVPLRVRAPGPDDLAGLFAVAEERFQRKFRAKDRLDLLVLAQALESRLGDRLAGVICDHAAELALAPELCQLVAGTDERVALSAAWAHTLERLRPLAREETARRREGRPGMYATRFGLPLDAVRGEGPRLVVHHRSGLDLATTPMGTCLLLERPEVTDEDLTRAVAHARVLSTAS